MADLADSLAPALKIFVSAGEASGDRQAAALINSLKELRADLDICAIGGSRLASEGAQILLDSRNTAVMGFTNALTKLPSFLPKLNKVKQHLLNWKPDVALLVDWGGVNVRLARWLKALDVPVMYFLPPRSWDRRARRDVAFIADAIATQFPWSKHILSGGNARVEWVGHPLVDLVQPKLTKAEAAACFDLDLSKPIVALVPGSRKAEIVYCLPRLVAAARLVNSEFSGTQFLVTASEETKMRHPLLEQKMRSYGLRAFVLNDMNYDALQCADAAAAVSGTATLELALLQIPMVVMYRVGFGAWLQYEIARRVTTLPKFFSLPNLIADSPIIEELMQRSASPRLIAQEIINLLSNSDRRDRMKEDLSAVCRQLGPPGAIRRAAEMVLDLVAYGSREQRLQPVSVDSS